MATSGKMGPRLPAAHTQVPAVEGRGHLPHSVPRSAPATVPRTPALPLGASEMPASVCPVPGSRRQMDIVTTRAGGGGAVRAPVVGGCPPFCLLLAPPQSPQSQGLRRAQTTTPRPPRCIPHPPRSLDIRPPSPGGAPAPLPPVRSSCPLTGSSAGCLPSGHHHQLSRNQKPHKQKITKPSAEINDIENKAIEKINENKNPIL